MTLYNPITDTSPAAPSVQSDATDYIFGLVFTVTANCVINGVWWYYGGDTQYNNSGGQEQIGLWTFTGGTATYVTGSATTAGTYSNGWNLIPFSSPISLTSGTVYAAIKAVDGGAAAGAGAVGAYCATASWFTSGGPGANGYSEGPVLVYSGVGGTSNIDPTGHSQQFFIVSTLDVTDVTGGITAFNEAWYGMDIQISTAGLVSGTASLTAAASLTALATVLATAALSATGSLTALGLQQAVAALDAVSSLGVLAEQEPVAALDSAASLTALGELEPVAPLTAASSLTVLGTLQPLSAMTAATLLSALAEVLAAVPMLGTSELQAAGVHPGAAAMEAVSSLSATPEAAQNGGGLLLAVFP
jgi:hypothetical protein